MKCAVCGYDDLGTGDSAHVCSTSVFMKYATPPSPSTAPIAEDELRAAATEVLKRWDTPLWRQEVGTAALMNRLRAALSSRPAGEVEELRALVEEWLCESCNTVYPGPPARGFACVICPKCGGSTGPRMLMENRKLRAELASKPAAIDAEEVASILEGALVDDLLPHHSPEWVERARAAIAQLRGTQKEPPCGS